MQKLNHELVPSWGGTNKNGKRNHPNYVRIPCHHCKESLVNRSIQWSPPQGFCYAFISCANCGKQTFFLIMDAEDGDRGKLYTYPGIPLSDDFPKELEDISSRGATVYSQALSAEVEGLDELAGMGLRKALEILIKDYLIHLYPNDEKKISNPKYPLMACIKDYLKEGNNIRDIAEKTVWLGNDETHYTRVWPNEDLESLKNLMSVTLYWIAMDAKAKKILSDMTKTNDKQQSN